MSVVFPKIDKYHLISGTAILMKLETFLDYLLDLLHLSQSQSQNQSLWAKEIKKLLHQWFLVVWPAELFLELNLDFSNMMYVKGSYFGDKNLWTSMYTYQCRPIKNLFSRHNMVIAFKYKDI